MSTTCITLSAKPAPKRVPSHIQYVNEVSVFKSMACDYAARLRAIAKVETEHFFFLDVDDYYGYLDVATDSLVVGTEYKVKDSARKTLLTRYYSQERHIANPWLIHNAVCFNTAAVRKALEQMPLEGEYYMQQMLTFVLLETHPYIIHPLLHYMWTIEPNGYHTKAGPAIENTKAWLNKRVLIPN